MRKCNKDEEEASAERHRIAATPTATVGAHARAQNGRKDEEGRKADEGEWRGGGLPERLKPGYHCQNRHDALPSLGTK